jgi:hypothetical protein
VEKSKWFLAYISNHYLKVKIKDGHGAGTLGQ